MSEIEQKAYALLKEVRTERGGNTQTLIIREEYATHEALCLAIERHETYKQKVSDAIEKEWGNLHYGAKNNFSIFIIDKPKPDLLEEVFRELQWSGAGVFAKSFRAVMKLRGLEIREKGA